MKQLVIGFSLLITCLLILFQLAKFTHWQSTGKAEWWLIGISMLFLVIGFLINRKFSSPAAIVSTEMTEKKDNNEMITSDSREHVDKALARLGISNREYEVLKLVSEGLSNQQIGQRLFVSENTIKKHISNLFFKLDVQRRTEAVKKAADLKILH